MSEDLCQGIILRVYHYSDTSLIVHTLTDHLGLISFIAKGAKRLKSPFAGKLDIFYHCQFELVLSKRNDLHTLKEVQLVSSHPLITQNYDLLCAATECTKTIEKVLERGASAPELFNLFCDYLKYIPSHLSLGLGNIIFNIRLLVLLGNFPQFAQMHISQDVMQLVFEILNKNWSMLLEKVPQEKDLQFLNIVSQREITRYRQ